MEIPFSTWYPAIARRRSHRRFDPERPIEPAKLAELTRVCSEFTPFPGVRVCLVNRPGQDIFKGLAGGYGKIHDAPAFLAFIGNPENPFVQEQTGYTGEGIILEATALGLNTCWIGGLFKPQSVASLIKISDNERILSVSPVGYYSERSSFEDRFMNGFGRNHKRLPVSRLLNNPDSSNFPDWVQAALEAARLAPSATNRQPWGFDVKDSSITVHIRTEGSDFSISKRLDCGIAMLHIEVAAGYFGINGKWEFLDTPLVARFVYT